MNSQPRITVGIPAFNEAQNIGELLRQIFAQKVTLGILCEVLVVSDGSSDDTAEIVRSYRDSRLRLIDRKERIGLNGTQNEIVSQVVGDVLVILNADVLLKSDRFIDEIIEPLLEDDRVGLVGADTVSVLPRTWFESVVVFSHKLKTKIYQDINQGDTVYLCHGRARAFSREIYSRIVWPGACPEDAYSYLFCVSRGRTFKYAKRAQVLFRAPTTLRDYIKQSQRFARGKRLLVGYFNPSFVRRVHLIPRWRAFRLILRYFMIDPLRTSSYGCIFVIGQLFFKESAANDLRYEVSPSTKKLIS